MNVREAAPATPPLPELAPERFVRANGADLCVQTVGDSSHPAVLLIAGGASSMLDWPEEFCQRLAAGGRFVIRYDHRDTGRSTTSPPGAPTYTDSDLTHDPLGVLDALGVATAHLVGFSAGGGIAQTLAAHHPDRVTSLTLASTSPLASRPNGPALPGPTAQAQATFSLPAPDWSDRTAVIDYLIAQYRPLAAASRPVPEESLRELATRMLDRAASIASMDNHWLLDPGQPTTWEQLTGITAPTLVLHGTEDPLLPLPHGAALAEAIPGARLLVLEHTGHELPPATWDTAIPAILHHTQGPS